MIFGQFRIWLNGHEVHVPLGSLFVGHCWPKRKEKLNLVGDPFNPGFVLSGFSQPARSLAIHLPTATHKNLGLCTAYQQTRANFLLPRSIQSLTLPRAFPMIFDYRKFSVIEPDRPLSHTCEPPPRRAFGLTPAVPSTKPTTPRKSCVFHNVENRDWNPHQARHC
jgi:hypothetical protein